MGSAAGHYDIEDGVLVWHKAKPKAETAETRTPRVLPPEARPPVTAPTAGTADAGTVVVGESGAEHVEFPAGTKAARAPRAPKTPES